MSKLIISENIAIFEYPSIEDPEFDFNDKGELFIMGYTMPFMGKSIGCAKRFELPLKGFKILGRYIDVKEKIIGDISRLISKFDNEINLLIFKENQ